MINPNTIDWLHCQDIQSTERDLQKQFNDYILNAQYAEAIKLLKNNEQRLKGRKYISEVINKIIDGVRYLQHEFYDNVDIFLANLSDNYRVMINSLRYMNEWNVGVEYKLYNFVLYNTEIYMAYKNPPVGVDPTNAEYWLRLGLRGHVGAFGIGVNIRYSWKENTKYNLHDVVAYGDNLYVALGENTGVVPGTDETTWLTFILVVQGGITVGPVEPEWFAQNSVWFKTDGDPLASDQLTSGQFLRYNSDAEEWENLYPGTLFSLITGTDVYTKKIDLKEKLLLPSEWQEQDGLYTYTFDSDPAVVQARYVEIVYGSEYTDKEFHFYSSWAINITNDGKIVLTTRFKPVTIFIKILIQ